MYFIAVTSLGNHQSTASQITAVNQVLMQIAATETIMGATEGDQQEGQNCLDKETQGMNIKVDRLLDFLPISDMTHLANNRYRY